MSQNDTTDRKAFDFWDRFCKLPAYSFMLGESGGFRRVPDKTGNWIERSQAQQVMDNAQAEINTLRSRLAAVTQKQIAPREHVTDGGECWCFPETVYVDPETGNAVIVHKEPT